MSIFSIHNWVMRKLMSQQSSVYLFNTLLSDYCFILNVTHFAVSFFQLLTYSFATYWQSLVLQIVIKCQIFMICSFSICKSLIWVTALTALFISSFSNISMCINIHQIYTWTFWLHRSFISFIMHCSKYWSNCVFSLMTDQIAA